MTRFLAATLVVWSLQLHAQVRVTAIERAAVAEERAWGGARFSPDGTRLYLTTPDYGGIWEHTIATGAIRAITDDRGSGFGFAVSPDGRSIAYRRTTRDEASRSRLQEIVSMDLATGSSRTIVSGRSVGTPAFAGERVIARADDPDLSAPVRNDSVTAVLGIEQMKIAVLAGGTRRLLEPLGEGRYVWPVLSPDGSSLAAYELARGAFVCGVDGSGAVLLGPYRAPAWTRDGLWVVCMDDRDDGHRLVGSRLVAVRREGGPAIELPGTEAIDAMYPACSPVDDLIACVSMTGDLFLIRYAAEGR